MTVLYPLYAFGATWQPLQQFLKPCTSLFKLATEALEVTYSKMHIVTAEKKH